ncbi:MAG: hypothetical protein NZ870_01720 [bacterium]|nr:hypothetical protein [bacterium]
MRFKIKIKKVNDMLYEATSNDYNCKVYGRSYEDAIEKIKNEILFILQSCPCDRVPEKAVEVEVSE